MPTSNLNLNLSLSPFFIYISLPHITSHLRGIIHWSYRRATVHCINLQFKSITKSALHTAGNNAYHSVSQCVPSQCLEPHNYMAQPVVSNRPHHTTDWYRLHRMIYWDYCMPRMAWRHAQVTGTITATLWPYGYPLTWLVNPAKLSGFLGCVKNSKPKTIKNEHGKISQHVAHSTLSWNVHKGVRVTTTLIRPSFSHWSLSLAHRCPTCPVPNWEVLIALSCHRLIWFYSLKQWPQPPREIRLMMVFHGISVGNSINKFKWHFILPGRNNHRVGTFRHFHLGFPQQMPKHIKKIITFQHISTNMVSSTRKHQSPCSCTVSPTVPLAAAAQASAIVRVRPELGIQRLTSAEISGTAKHHVESGHHFHIFSQTHPPSPSHIFWKPSIFFSENLFQNIPTLNPGIVIPETAGCRCRCRHRIRLIRWLAWPRCPRKWVIFGG